jgi:ferri-bacillibactin esterase
MTIDNTGAALADTEIHYLQSRHVGDEFKLFVSLPTVPLPDGYRLPVIYALDANMTFGIVSDTARAMAIEGAVPPALIVGIGYRTGWLIPDAWVKRTRDFTPTSIPTFDRLASAMLPGAEGRTMESGRAAAFLRFIREELKPFIAARYPVDSADATVTGISLGGLFPLVTLFTEPDTFQRYLACSPSIWWDKEWLLAEETKYAATHRDLPARLFIAAGGEETDANSKAQMAAMPESVAPLGQEMLNRDGKVMMVEYLETFVPTLRSRGYPRFLVHAHRFDGETHMSVYGAAVARGLRVLFARD